jgi:hypothetical protein
MRSRTPVSEILGGSPGGVTELTLAGNAVLWKLVPEVVVPGVQLTF